jgi:RsiW-degrading membrane proteinase PrsW (M82 family)
MSVVGALLIGIGPAALWLAYFLRKDRFEPEPWGLLLRTLARGGVAAVAAAVAEAVVEYSVVGSSWVEKANPLEAIILAFAFVGPIEEVTKFLAVRLGPYRDPEFDEPVDGLVYAAAASLGYAAVENLVYIAELGPQVMVGRALFSTLGHVLFSVPWGVALGLRRCVPGTGSWVVAAGLLAGIALHGLYDALLLVQHPLALGAFVLLVFPAMALLPRWAFRHAERLSPYVGGTWCEACAVPVRRDASWCPVCRSGARLGLRCRACAVVLRAGVLFCTQCGAGVADQGRRIPM